MRHSPLLFCALILLSATLRATPAEDFMARGKELLANKEKLSEPDRLHRLFAFSWEFGTNKLPNGDKIYAFHDEVLKNGALPLSVLESHLKEWVAKAKKA